MKKLTWSGSAVAAAALTLVLSGCSSTPAAVSNDTLNIATLTMPQSLDPNRASGSSMPFFQAAYDTLIKREPNGDFTPMLATEWSYDDSFTRLAITLRDDVTFDDGTKFGAAAVKANLERFHAGGGADAKALDTVTAIEVVDETHVTLTLDQPDPGLLWRLTDSVGIMANPASFDDPDALATTPDGTGPYELDAANTVVGTKWVYTRTDDYWGEKLPYDTITISVFDNENAIVNGLRTGQLDAALVQVADQRAAAKQDPNLKVVDAALDYQSIMLFDRAGALTPALGDVRVRQALNHAIDRETMLAQLRQGLGEITSQIFGPASQGYEKELDTYYAHDPEKAKQLLREAGYPDGFELKLPRLATMVDDALATSLQTDMAKIGVTLIWEDVEMANAGQRIFRDRAYSAMVMNFAQLSSDWLTISAQILPGQFNFFGYTDPTELDLVSKIRTTAVEDSAEDLKALNTHIVKEAWFVPFYRMTYAHVSASDVTVVPQSDMAAPSIYNYSPSR